MHVLAAALDVVHLRNLQPRHRLLHADKVEARDLRPVSRDLDDDLFLTW